MNILVIHNTKDTPGHLKDATGAFVPEAVNFETHHKALGDVVERIPFDNLLPISQRPGVFLDLLSKAKPFDAFAYFGHGLRNSLSSAAVTQAERPAFVRLLASKAKSKRLIVTLYACSTGETTAVDAQKHHLEDGEGGFADRVRDDLVAAGFSGWVDGHTCAAHTTQNPFVRRFECDPNDTIGGNWLITPHSAEWGRWQARLDAKWRTDPFRFDFPYLDAATVLASCR